MTTVATLTTDPKSIRISLVDTPSWYGGWWPSRASMRWSAALEALSALGLVDPVLDLICEQLEGAALEMADEFLDYGRRLGPDVEACLDNLDDDEYEARTGTARAARAVA